MEFADKTKTWLEPKLRWLKESWQEVRHKVTWPSKDEVWGTTRVVLAAVIAFAIIVGTMDYVLYTVLDKLFQAVA